MQGKLLRRHLTLHKSKAVSCMQCISSSEEKYMDKHDTASCLTNREVMYEQRTDTDRTSD